MSDFDNVPLANLADYINGMAFKPDDFTDSGLPVIRIEQLKNRKASFDLYDKPVAARNRIQNGDLIFSWSASLFLQIWDRGPAILNQHLFRVDPKPDVDKLFLKYRIEESLPDLVNASHGSTMQHITRKELDKCIVNFPRSKAQQAKIAQVLATLDRVIAQTDSLLDKQQRVKAGLMQELLTRGIDADGKMRPSQVSASTPYSGWQVRRLGDVAEVASGLTLGRVLSGPNLLTLPYLRVFNVQDGYLDLSDVKTVAIRPNELSRYCLQKGDVLMNEGGDFDKLGRGAVWEGQIKLCLHQNHVFRVRTNRKVLLPDFLALISASAYGKAFFVLHSKQSTNLASINSTQLKSFPIPCPDVEEQKRLLEVAREQDIVLASTQNSLRKMRSLKAGLMQDLLTGRVSVLPLMGESV